MSPSTRLAQLALIASNLFMVGNAAFAVETVTFKSDKKDLVNGAPSPTRTVVGEILVEAQDGGLMLQSDDGRIWVVQPEQITSRESDDAELTPLTADQMADRLREELPSGFEVYQTSHYVVVHNTTDRYARQVGLLFEQLYKGFYAYWKNQGWRLPEPRFPLVALVLADRNDFLRYAGAEVGSSAQYLFGYYNPDSNRMMTYNLPSLERNVATIIHEATHQLSYNCGLQTRYADNPKWLSEGLAMYFESPDFSSVSKWRGIGRVNQVNLTRWRQYQTVRPRDSLASLIAADSRFTNTQTAEQAYGESWALTYFLLRTRKKEFVKYIRLLSEGKPLAEKTPRERIEMFESTFGDPLEKIDRSFVLYMNRVR
ncbi:MAG: DUF1570 domain-containing protein [Planctomycetota bacterium]